MSQKNNAQLAPDQQAGAVYHLCYVSAETVSFSQDELVSLLTDARQANAERDVTGLLLYREGCFYQVLEGSESAVRQTFEDIQSDPRHKEVRVLFSGDTEAREFADWQMGFINLDGVELGALTGYSDFLSREDNAKDFLENLSRGKRLALMFRSME